MHSTRSYHWSKGVPAHKVEDHPWANLATMPTGRRLLRTISIQTCEQSLMQIHQRVAEHSSVKGRSCPTFYLGHSLLHRERGAKHSPPGALDNLQHLKSMRIMIVQNVKKTETLALHMGCLWWVPRDSSTVLECSRLNFGDIHFHNCS